MTEPAIDAQPPEADAPFRYTATVEVKPTIELPALDVFRVRTSLLAPLGRTVLLGMRGEGEHRQILLLTPRLVSRP